MQALLLKLLDSIKMLKFKLTYSDGAVVIKEFESEKEAAWYIHNEGDHLIYVERLAG